MQRRIPLEERFHMHTVYEDDCIVWTGSKTKAGYGRITITPEGELGQTKFAHRVMYEMQNGPIEEGLIVMHSCDNPSCVNPNHLTLGTHKDNFEDSVTKGRMKIKGEEHPCSKLTNKDVIKIRKLINEGMRNKDILKLYQVHHSVISNIKYNRSRKHG